MHTPINADSIIGQGKIFSYFATDYAELLTKAPNPSLNQIAYIYNSQGTPYLPGSWGGNYYPQGTYIYNGTNWVNDNNALNNQLQDNIDEILTKLDDVTAGTNITIDKTDPLNPIISSTGGGGGATTITLAKPQGDAIASAGSSYLASSGRTFFSHSGTGMSDDECAFSFQPKGWVSGAKVWVDIASANDGADFMKYKATISVNNGGVQVQETIEFTKVLTDDTSLFEKLSTDKKTFSSTITDAITSDSNITVKVIRDAGDVEDDYSGLSYTEFFNFEYNY